jgi:hypothetical protein
MWRNVVGDNTNNGSEKATDPGFTSSMLFTKSVAYKINSDPSLKSG